MDKETLRRQVLAARQAEPGRDEKSQKIWERLVSLAEFKGANNLVFYVNVGSEVRTRPYIARAIELDKRVLVPYSVNEEISLCEIRSLSELEPGAMNIFEPKTELRCEPDRQCSLDQLELIIVPGVAFDRKGARLGRGRGFYDRFLNKLQTAAVFIAPAFECQLVDYVPMDPLDMFVDKIVTEQAIYDCREHRESDPDVA